LFTDLLKFDVFDVIVSFLETITIDRSHPRQFAQQAAFSPMLNGKSLPKRK